MAGIFKAYDIRGVVGEALTPQRAYWIGRALAAEVFGGQSPIVVSRDMRTHSPKLAAQLVQGLREGGCDVIDVGLAATPMNYWANMHFQSRGSVTVTASHNGPEYNGFKVSGPSALPIGYETGLDRVEAFVTRAESGKAPPANAQAGALRVVENILTDYLTWMHGFVETPRRPLKIAIDAGNGMGGLFLSEFFAPYDLWQPVPLYWELDGTFPNHEADPLKEENLRDLQAKVIAEKCDLGVAFDGDADRCMFVDENGENISSDLTTALIAESFLAKTPGAPILYDLRSSQTVPEWITLHGGQPVRGRVGHSFMKRLLRETGAPFGGELSGHYYFADCFNTDSGLRAMIAILNVLQQREQSLSQIVAPLRKYVATGELNFHVRDTQDVLKQVEAHFDGQDAKIDHLDGLTVEFPDWWFNLRPSNTEPLLRLNLEAANADATQSHLQMIQSLIQGFA